MHKYILLILSLVASSLGAIVEVTNYYDYIIVGSGWAGLGACTTLTAKGAKVLIIEAKNRKGGRCASFNYGGI
jgi:monoamine oxidase